MLVIRTSYFSTPPPQHVGQGVGNQQQQDQKKKKSRFGVVDGLAVAGVAGLGAKSYLDYRKQAEIANRLNEETAQGIEKLTGRLSKVQEVNAGFEKDLKSAMADVNKYSKRYDGINNAYKRSYEYKDKLVDRIYKDPNNSRFDLTHASANGIDAPLLRQTKSEKLYDKFKKRRSVLEDFKDDAWEDLKKSKKKVDVLQRITKENNEDISKTQKQLDELKSKTPAKAKLLNLKNPWVLAAGGAALAYGGYKAYQYHQNRKRKRALAQQQQQQYYGQPPAPAMYNYPNQVQQ